MQEPDLKTTDTAGENGSGAKPSGRKNRSWKKIFLYFILVMIVLLVGGYYAVRMKYSNEYLKNLAQEQIATAINGECSIDEFDVSITGSATIKGLSLKPGGGAGEQQFLKIQSILAKLNVMKSITSFRPDITLLVSNTEIDIERVLSAEQHPAVVAVQDDELALADPATAPEEKYSSNIHDTLRSLAEFDWKQQLKDLYWRDAALELKVTNTIVRVHDREKRLGECLFTVNFSADLNDKEIAVKLNIAEDTPVVPEGELDLVLNIVFDWDAAAARSDKPLAFIGSLDLNTQITNFDLEYPGRYYIQNDDQAVRLDSPLSGSIRLNADDMAAVNLGVKLSLAKAVKFVKDNKELAGGVPDLAINVQGLADLSQEWSVINKLIINILSKNVETGKELVNISGKINGSFGSEISAVFEKKLGIGNILQSSAGKLIELEQGVEGGLKLGMEFIWKKDADWDYVLRCASDKLIIVNKGLSTPAPVNAEVRGMIKTGGEFDPQTASVNVKVTSPGVEIKTAQAILVPLKAEKFTPAGEADLYINLPQVFEVFAAPLAVFGLQRIDEIIEAKITVQNEETIALTAEIKNTQNKYQPCLISGSATTSDTGKFAVKLEAVAENKAVQVVTAAEGTSSDGKLAVDFSNQFALRAQAGLNLARRFGGIKSGLEIPKVPVTGVIRGGTKGKVAGEGEMMSLALGSSLALSDITFTTPDGRMFVEKNGKLAVNLSINDLNTKQNLILQNFNWQSDSLSATAKVQHLGLAEFNKNPLAGMGHLKGAEVLINVEPAGFKNVSALLSGQAAEWARNGKLLKVAINTEDNGMLRVKACELQSMGLNAALKNLQFNPQQLAAQVEQQDFDGLLSGISAFSILLNSDNTFWKSMTLPKGLEFRGKAEVAINYEPEQQRLNIQKIVLAGDSSNKAFVSRLSAATVVDRIGELLKNPELPQIINSLSKGVNIPVVTVSVPALREFLAANGSNLPLKGSTVELQNFRLLKAKAANTFQLYGNLNSPALEIQDMLSFKGNILLNNLITLGDNGTAVTGELKLDKAGIYFKAAPYVYRKAQGTASKLYYKLNAGNDGSIAVAQAGMAGGPVVFGLRDFSFTPRPDGKFALSLPVLKVSAPIGLSISNVEVNPASDVVKAQVVSPGIDLSSLSKSLELGFPSRLSGKIGGINLVVNDKYSTLIEQDGKRISAQNKFVMAPSTIRLDATDGSASMQLGIGKIAGDTGSGKFALGGMTVTAPASGAAAQTPIALGKVVTAVDMDTLFKKPLIINDIIIDSFKAIYEMKAQGNNMDILQANIEKLLPADSGSSTQSAGSPSSASAPAGVTGSAVASTSRSKSSGVLIRNLYLNNGVVDLKTPIIKGNFDIPPTHLKDLGGDNPRVALTTVMQVLVKSIGASAVTLLQKNPAQAVEAVTGLLGDVLKKSNKTTDGDADKSDGEAVDKHINQGIKALQGLFGK